LDGEDWTDDYFNRARERLFKDVAEWAAGRYTPFVVFDAAGNQHSEQKRQRIGRLTVVFSAYGQSADSQIELMAKRYQEAGAEVTVLSADAQLQWTVMQGHVTRMSVLDFCRELETAQTPDTGERTPWTNHLADHLDPAVRAKLDRMRGK
jgi:predicted RNA-binding protein with PIN domain